MNKITIDTNVLVRLLIDDNTHQQAMAVQTLDSANLVAIPTGVIMETVWVLSYSYKVPKTDILSMLRQLILSIPKIRVIDDEVEAGFLMMEMNGDFADAIHAYTGKRLGGDVFVTFDRQAASLLKNSGTETKLLS